MHGPFELAHEIKINTLMVFNGFGFFTGFENKMSFRELKLSSDCKTSLHFN